MKFIFPKNYNFKNKLFGIIDYSSLFVNLLWDVFVFCFINLILINITIKIFIFIVLCLPLRKHFICYKLFNKVCV